MCAYIYTVICKSFEPSRIYIDISLYLGVHLFLGAIFRKQCFPCDISIELPSRCKSCMLSHISHLTETHQNCFHICIYILGGSKFLQIGVCVCVCVCVNIYNYMCIYIYIYKV